ncbi:hypothetical protein GOODEAATRI_014489, partial [Goodea atripinnis]
LSVWEPGEGLRTWLEGVEVCAAQFCALAHQENHELTELLQNYWRCRRQLNQSHTQLHTQSSDCKSTQNRLWSFRDEQLTLQVSYYCYTFAPMRKNYYELLFQCLLPLFLQGVCADQNKVCGYHRFQQAEFSQSVLAELRVLFDVCSELLHQKVVLHAYTALLSRLQVESYLYRLLKGLYEPQACSSQKMMRVFAFASSLIEILALGLQTYNRARYRQLVKRIGRIIRSVSLRSKFYMFVLLVVRIDLKHQERFEGWLCEVNSSDGISLLTALAHMATPTQHFDPAFITTITLLIYQMALYLCKELPLSLWKPQREEISMIGAWLLQNPLSAVSYLASVLRLGVSQEASFSQWAWQLLLRLKLHGNAQTPKGGWTVPALASNPPPELTHAPSMHSVLRAVKAGLPIGCYLSLAMTTVGHSHVVESSRPDRVGAAAVLEFWVGILTQQNLWYRDKTVLFLMDQICCAAFIHHQQECVQKLMYQQHKNALGYHGDRGLLSSLVGWIAGNATPSFIDGQSLSGEVRIPKATILAGAVNGHLSQS